MEVEKAEDVEEVEDVEGAKGRTSSSMGITGAAKFDRRSFRFLGRLQAEPLAERNGTFNLKNVWQLGVTDAFFVCVARKEVSRFCALGEKLARCRKAHRKRRA